MESKRIQFGTLGLKRPYQRNLAVGFGVSGMMHLTIMVSLALFVFQAKDIVIAPPGPVVMDTVIIQPPHRGDVRFHDKVKTSENKAVPDIGTMVPVPDDIAPAETDIPNQDQLAILAPDTPIEDLGRGFRVDVEKVLAALVPPPETFTPFDEPPVQVSSVLPVYPELAQRTGLEGYVWVKAYIDKEGKVLDVIIAKASPPDIGFEEAAIESARQTVWRPAISNGVPIGVWITYKVEFRLR